MSVCPSCGKDNRKESRFCQACGTRLAQAGLAQAKDHAAGLAPVPPSAAPAAPAPAPAGGSTAAPQRKRSSQEVAQGPTCSSCGTLNAPGMRFCKMCGSPLSSPVGGGSPGKITCASCGGQTPAGYKFCQHCGSPLPQGAESAAPAPALAKAPSASVQPASLVGKSPVNTGKLSAASPEPGPEDDSAAGQRQPVAPTLVPAGLGLKPGTEDSIRTLMDLSEEQPAAAPLGPGGSSSGQLSQTAGVVSQTAGVVGSSRASGDFASIATSVERQASVGAQPTIGPGAARQQVAWAAESLLAELVTVNRDGTDGETHPITEETFDLGRTMGQLQFEEDPYLSDRHCRFFVQNSRWLVQDLQSVNGVYLRARGEQALEHGDHLLLGKQVLVFEWLSEHERELAPAVEHGVLFFGSPLRSPWARLRQLSVAGIYRDVYYLQLPQLILGREEGDLLFSDDEFMSRRHLSLSLVGSRAMVQDLGSSNGTYIRIRQQHVLQHGDMIRLGDQLLRFQPK